MPRGPLLPCLLLLGALPAGGAEVEIRRSTVTKEVRDECRLESFTIFSHLMQREIQVRVVLPPDYDSSREKSFAILYCLNGMGAPYATFSEMAPLRRRLKSAPSILAMFDAGVGSFYLDAADGGMVPKSVLFREPRESEKLSGGELDKAVEAWKAIPDKVPSLYTSFFFNEYVPALDHFYRVDARNRAITGFSMGGFGAMHFMLEKPAFFRSISGLSSAFYTREALARRAGRGNALFSRILGEYSTDAASYGAVLQMERSKNLVQSGVKLPPVYQHCGDEDRLLDVNRAMVEHLKAIGCSVEFRSSPGGHNWDFWQSSSADMFDFHWRHFETGQK